MHDVCRCLRCGLQAVHTSQRLLECMFSSLGTTSRLIALLPSEKRLKLSARRNWRMVLDYCSALRVHD